MCQSIGIRPSNLVNLCHTAEGSIRRSLAICLHIPGGLTGIA